MPHQNARSVSKKPGRSTTGCTNCKIRKVKCDEGKPTCLRCHDRHLECPGYPTNVLKWSSKHEVHNVGNAQDLPNPNRRPVAGQSTVSRATESAVAPVRRNVLFNTSSSSVLDPAKQTSLQIENTGTFGTLHSPAAAGGSQITAAGSKQYSYHIDHAFEILTADLGLANSCAPFEQGDVFSPTDSSTSESYRDSARCLFCSGVDGGHTTGCSANALVLGADQVEPLGDESSPLESLNLPSMSPMWKQKFSTNASPLSTTLLHVPTLLVDYYFQKVCRECSTFDSSANPFRSKISEMRHTSAPVYYVIQSLAAAKLADDMPRMKVVGMEAQGKALQTLKDEFLAVNALHAVSDEVLYTLLLLGMTTSWHTREDLGLEYFHLARRIIVAKSQTQQTTRQSNLDFFQNALTYWTMITSMVSGDVESSDAPVADSFTMIGPSSLPVVERIMPHPWAGISPRSLQLFGQVLQLIRRTRGGLGNKTSSSYSRAGIAGITNAIATAERLEAECWSVSIPSVDHLKDTGDSWTPPLHYVLTAKAYLLSALLHLYMIFPDVLETRIQSAFASGTMLSASEGNSRIPSSVHMICQSYLWSQRSPGDHRDAWLKDVGIRIVECLESINSRSSTRVVHPPLLLSVASALTLSRGGKDVADDWIPCRSLSHLLPPQLLHEVDIAPRQTTEASNTRVRQCRSFLVSRLETMQAAMRFHAIDNVLKVIKEIWRRSDAGQQDTFWMDVMSELHCETLFG